MVSSFQSISTVVNRRTKDFQRSRSRGKENCWRYVWKMCTNIYTPFCQPSWHLLLKQARSSLLARPGRPRDTCLKAFKPVPRPNIEEWGGGQSRKVVPSSSVIDRTALGRPSDKQKEEHRDLYRIQEYKCANQFVFMSR
ncbi:hypothetical protein ACROYT_G001198 [Oculina patagonica]